MKVLVTGATGFLGRYVVEELIKDYDVFALGRNASHKEEIENMGAIFCQGDLSDIEACRGFFKALDFVVHAGALSTVWGNWEDFYKNNVLATENVAKLCVANGVKRLVYISSPSIYSQAKDCYNVREEDFNHNNKLNFYIKSKIMSEDVLKSFASKGLYTVTLRPRGLIGRGDSGLVPRILNVNETIGIPLFNGGKNLVDITCVENVAYAVRLSLEKENIKGEIFNITNDQPMEFREILNLFFKVTNRKPKFLRLPLGLLYALATVLEVFYKAFAIKKEPPITKYTICTLGYSQTLNIDKAKEKLGYKAIVPLIKGVESYGER